MQRNPVGVDASWAQIAPRVAAAPQPWAMFRDAFGVKLADIDNSVEEIVTTYDHVLSR